MFYLLAITFEHIRVNLNVFEALVDTALSIVDWMLSKVLCDSLVIVLRHELAQQSLIEKMS